MKSAVRIKSAVNKIKNALATKGVDIILQNYLIDDGMIIASNIQITAGTPINIEGSMLIPGVLLEKVLEKFDDPDPTFTKTEMKFREGRFRATIRLPEYESGSPTKPVGDWVSTTKELLPALKLARGFILEDNVQAYTKAVSIEKGVIWATNAMSMVRVSCPGLNGEGELVPYWVIDYLTQQDTAPAYMILDKSHVAFKWNDGSWMRSQLIDGKFTDKAESILDRASGEALPVTAEWLRAYKKVAELSEHELHIYAHKISGGGQYSEIEYEIKSAAPKKGASVWNPKALTPVLEVCTHFAFDSWPNPSKFFGDNIKGVIVGRAG